MLHSSCIFFSLEERYFYPERIVSTLLHLMMLIWESVCSPFFKAPECHTSCCKIILCSKCRAIFKINKFSYITCVIKITINTSQCNLRKINGLVSIWNYFVKICPTLNLSHFYFPANLKAGWVLHNLALYT